MRTFAITVVIVNVAFICILGCDKITGGENKAPPPAPAVAPPQQPATPQPAAAAPGQPAHQPVPGQPAPTPLAPPSQPAAAPVPGQPTVAPVPGQPTAAAPGQPAAPPTPPTPTGDALRDKLNAKKFEVAPELIATSALLKQELKKGEPQPYQVTLPGPPFCHTYVVAADDKVKNIDLTIESPAGVKEAADETVESTATVTNHFFWCGWAPPTPKTIFKLRSFSNPCASLSRTVFDSFLRLSTWGC